MTVKELSRVFELEREMRIYDQRIDELRAQRTATQAPAFDTEPGGGRGDPSHSKIEELTAEIIDLEKLMRLHRKQILVELQRLERYIYSVDDLAVRRIMQLRFAELKNWNDVASEMNYTVEAVKKRLYRYLKKHSG